MTHCHFCQVCSQFGPKSGNPPNWGCEPNGFALFWNVNHHSLKTQEKNILVYISQQSVSKQRSHTMPHANYQWEWSWTLFNLLFFFPPYAHLFSIGSSIMSVAWPEDPQLRASMYMSIADQRQLRWLTNLNVENSPCLVYHFSNLNAQQLASK